jgi:DNA-binding transcriptional LysR family regulator
MSELEARQLRYFVAVAEELHFGRAAERLGMAQPPLSRAIRELERRLGVALLERTTRQVGLTPAGEVLLRDARTALDAITAADRRARNAGRLPPRLRLALKADNDAGLLPAILDAYRDEKAALEVELVLGGWNEQAAALRDGRADVALLPTPFDGRGLDSEPLHSEPRVAVLAAADPLAARPELSLADLADRPRHRDTPGDRRLPPQDLAQILRLVELGEFVFFLPVSVARRYGRPELACRPVAGLEPATLSVAWPADSRSPAVAAFVRVAVAAADVTRPPR